MRRMIFVIGFLITAFAANSQVKISGTVKDNRGKPVPNASVTLKNTYDGTTADSSGNYSFTTTEKGSYQLEATALGYKTIVQPITLDKENINLSFSLKEEMNELTAVVVTAGSFEAGDKKRAATVLSSIDIVTTAGSNADISAAVKTLPGAQQIGEQEGLFVRGGTGYETKQFIDGTLVNNPYFTSVPDIASRGRFSPFLFKGTVFSTGGYSALYGEALSSALILESIDLPQRSAANASISPIFMGGGIQQLSKNKNASWGADYGYVNLIAYFNIVKQKPDYFTMPEYHNADANFRIKTKSGGMIKYYTTYSNGRLGLRRPDIDSTNIKDAFYLHNTNWYNNIAWRETLGKGWKWNLGLSYSTNKDDISQQLQNANNQPQIFPEQSWLQDKIFSLHNRQDLTQIKPVLEKKLNGLSAIRFGGEYWYAFNKSFFNDSLSVLKDNFTSAFAESDIYLNSALAAKVGGRLEHSSLINKTNIAPRISLAYKVAKNAQVSAAYGIFYQKPENQQLIYTTNLAYTKATHYIINYQKTANDRIFRVEAFYKKYEDLIKTYPLYNNNGTGFAKGIEFFWRDKKTIKDFDYWISYSYLDTKRDYLNYPFELQPNFAAKHTASIVTKRFVTKWKTGFNFTYSYATGRPYYNLIQSTNKYLIADEGKTKDFHNMGFSVNYLPNLGKQNAKTFIVLFASVTNMLGANQVYGYTYSYNGLNKEPIEPPAKRFYFIGCFLSWGIDRSQDAINNNL
ncbi:MAG: TonB-dependent receptor [Parafilimonas sp.]